MKPSYSEEEANAILRRAIENAPVASQMSREQLVAIASELGIAPEALQKAEADLKAEEQDKADRKAYISKRRRRFWRHLSAYAGVNLLFFLMALASGGGDKAAVLFFTVLIGWGVGLVVHGACVLPARGAEFEEKFARWRLEQRVLAMATEQIRHPEIPWSRVQEKAAQIAAEELDRPPRLS